MRTRQRRSALDAIPISPLLAVRIALGAFGVWVASIGLRALLRGHPFAANAPVGRWLVGGVLAHDAVIAPTVFLLGAVIVRLTGPRIRQALAAILLVGGSVLIVGLPDVLRKGHNTNVTVTPLDYTRNLVVVLLAVVGAVVLTTAASALRQRRRDRHAPVPLASTEQSSAMDEPEPGRGPRPEADADVDDDIPEGEEADDIIEAEVDDVPAAEDGAVVEAESTRADDASAADPMPVEPDASTNPRGAA